MNYEIIRGIINREVEFVNEMKIETQMLLNYYVNGSKAFVNQRLKEKCLLRLVRLSEKQIQHTRWRV